LKKCGSSLRGEIAKNQRPGTFLEPFGPEKVPGIVQYFLDAFYRQRPRRFLKPSHRRTTRSRGRKYPQGRRLLGALCDAGTGTPARITKEAVAHRFSRKCNSLFLLWAISPPMQKILWSA
jgi:hypothetical protein